MTIVTIKIHCKAEHIEKTNKLFTDTFEAFLFRLFRRLFYAQKIDFWCNIILIVLQYFIRSLCRFFRLVMSCTMVCYDVFEGVS